MTIYPDDTVSKCCLYDWMGHKKHKDIAVGRNMLFYRILLERKKSWHKKNEKMACFWVNDACCRNLKRRKKTESNVDHLESQLLVFACHSENSPQKESVGRVWSECKKREKTWQQAQKLWWHLHFLCIVYTKIILCDKIVAARLLLLNANSRFDHWEHNAIFQVLSMKLNDRFK